ncbi:MAG: molecular chaperone DnaK [Candidatus Terrybacteria bacterium RIFCSPLOWO2_01_FULL_44_24]|uniref:Chaperone protein DnaK n=1 Tax=Candidatus Terrybacteria bacterium RIFCSPHIGHO2_01_FULL_43_35 TaxID=1802361 RepID=A0A1G2PHF5_9BACT|nr:MAG: molecular chaperone DnaK [Candidatus Terrybacteria bacterium RIFCSPHIGHO2_01_FULL_43_35]OHA49962.1 MAG: molecular chaperone DnaK [Candidatus Terrybacteria bacterium RIFCSPHIGHO2_02_FULL_43_14]OHA51716.1 MAG: molecular chaperone DnaK [Candidatus Terrybacteria bacterium RIFCSPLOWO2_01_FULL_44_24]
MSKILGIDLGTTNSAMAIMEGGEPKIIENSEGARTTPSMVAANKSGERLAGILAKRQAVTNAENTIFSVKRLIGRRFLDQEVQRDKQWLPYTIREASNGGVEVKMVDKWYAPQEISAMVLSKLKTNAEARLGIKITDAVITVPAYFDDSQRKATKEAGEIAGFNVRRIINEPTAAALAYGLEKKKNEKIVVYDFGGGTFDVSVLEISTDTVEVKATGGDTHLGGDDFDKRLIEWMVDEFKKDQGIDLSRDKLALQRLKEAAERAKHELSSTHETEINIPFITSDAEGPKHLLLKLSRAKLEELVNDHIEKAAQIVAKVVGEAKFALSDINEVVMVGGQTRMPAIQDSVRKLFGKEPHTGINPDEVVAIGAAAQGGIMEGEVRDVLLLDVTPLSLGIETLGNVMTPIIEKNTTIPVSKSQVFSTAADNQPSVEIHVLQGERVLASDNKTLARFILDGIPPSPRGIPQVEVSFDIDANGILNVAAKDKATSKVQTVRIEASTGLSKEEIERMKKEAELHAEDDRRKKEMVETINTADALIYSVERTLRENTDKISLDIRSSVEDKLKELKEAKSKDDIAALRRAIEDVNREAQKIGSSLYEQNKNSSPSDANSDSQGQNKEDIADGEVETDETAPD